jgi:hypothetical protein
MGQRFTLGLLLLAIMAGIGWSLYIQFTHLDMTPARLLVTYWPGWLTMVVVVGGLAILYFRKYT